MSILLFVVIRIVIRAFVSFYLCMCTGLGLYRHFFSILGSKNIGRIMVSVLVSSVVDPGFETRVSQIKDYKFGI